MPKPDCEAEFSTLEVVPHDAPANAPELDFFSTAPELDRTLEALQSDQRLKALRLDRTANLPEANLSAEFPEVVEDFYESWPRCGIPWKSLWVIATVSCITIISVGLGSGLGIGLKKGNSPQTSISITTPLASPSQTTRYVI